MNLILCTVEHCVTSVFHTVHVQKFVRHAWSCPPLCIYRRETRHLLCCRVTNHHALFATDQGVQNWVFHQTLECGAMHSGHHSDASLCNVSHCSDFFCTGDLIHNHNLQSCMRCHRLIWATVTGSCLAHVKEVQRREQVLTAARQHRRMTNVASRSSSS